MPVDAYGVGSSLLRGKNDFTADMVLRDGRPAAKVGPARATERTAGRTSIEAHVRLEGGRCKR